MNEMMEKLDVQKQTLKGRMNANFSHYASGELFYIVELESGTYQFPIATIDSDWVWADDGEGGQHEVKEVSLSSDLGSTPFEAEVRASSLNRWIGMAIDKDEFVKVK